MYFLTTKAARIIFAVPFGVFSFSHFVKSAEMANIVPPWLPGSVFWVYFTGLVMLAACICIVKKMFITEACLGLAVLLLVFIVTVHIPGLSHETTAQMAMSSLLKDISLTGSALTLAGVYIRTDTRKRNAIQ